MRKFYLSVIMLCISFSIYSQRLLTWTPEFPTDNGNITFTIDATKGNRGLFNYEGGNSNNVYVHIGLITSASTSASDWKYTKFTWGSTDPLARATALGSNRYSYTINNIRSFFGVPAGESIRKITVLFRNADGSLKQTNSDNSDMYIPVYNAGELAVRLNLPVTEPRFIPWVEPISISAGQPITVTGVSTASSSLTLRLNGNVVGTATSATTITATPNVVNCENKIILEGTSGSTTVRDSVVFFIAPTTAIAALPSGLKDGINYEADPTAVTLVLYAPNKNNVVVVGDFSNWTVACLNQMNRTPDNLRYWIRLTGLTSGQLYKFQYLVDGTIRTTDPYTELILDPSYDGTIPATSYPNIPSYPTGNTTGIVGTFQTNQQPYNWTATGYTRPDKKNLVIYELLLRDFLAQSNYQVLIDTLTYIQKLGVNAIELLPVTEYEGNSSWGYNPSFFFAPDKAYGPKNLLKKFIDEAHKKGIAVIMDAVLNHATNSSPLAQLYWDAGNNRPAANSPYFNVNATHPFNVFNDFNHDSEATKYHTARYIRHWLTEYRIDGFRWDLSKGFTQRICADVNCWNAYDAARVATWQRYYDSTQAVSPGSVNILEHLGNDDEESDLASRGMLLWGKMTDQYNQNTMGYSDNSNLGRVYHGNRSGWTQPHLVGYAESHDEERIMFKNKTFGNSSNPSHDVKSLPVALKRTEAMQPFLLMVPGPKMIYQFQELGYDHSIFECFNGTLPTPYGNDQCKLDNKPFEWGYNNVPERKRIYHVIAALNKLRMLKPQAFIAGSLSGSLDAGLVKQFRVVHSDLSFVVAGNFDVTNKTININFPSAGTWYNFIDGGSTDISGTSLSAEFAPGEYRIYLNQDISSGLELPVPPPPPVRNIPNKNGIGLLVYPNPAIASGKIDYMVPTGGKVNIRLYSYSGQYITTILDQPSFAGTYTIPVPASIRTLASGMYMIRILQNGKSFTTIFFKNNPK